MLREEKLAWSTCGIAVHAFRFLYHMTLQRPAATFTVPGPKQPQKLPEILSPEEVRRVIESTANRRQRALLATTYAAGLRVSELVHLKVTDIDAQRMSLRLVRLRRSGAGQGGEGSLHPPFSPTVGGAAGLFAGVPAPGGLALPEPRRPAAPGHHHRPDDRHRRQAPRADRQARRYSRAPA